MTKKVPDNFILNTNRNYVFKRGDYFRYDKSNYFEVVSGYNGESSSRFYKNYPDFEIYIKPTSVSTSKPIPKPALKFEQITDKKFVFNDGIKYFYRFNDSDSWTDSGNAFLGHNLEWVEARHVGIKVVVEQPRFKSNRKFPFGY